MPDLPQDKIKGVIVHFHGTGARGGDLNMIKEINIFKYAERKGDDFPFIIIAPQCHSDSWFDIFEQLQKFIEGIREKYAYQYYFLIGYSMGAYAGWQMLQSKPEFFKKAVLFCGGGHCWTKGRIKAEVWAIHGIEDEEVAYSESVKMGNSVVGYGGKAKLTLLENVDHHCWEKYYLSDEIYEFLIK